MITIRNSGMVSVINILWIVIILQPTGSREREVDLWEGWSIPVAVLLSCKHLKTFALHFHKHEYSWVVK